MAETVQFRTSNMAARCSDSPAATAESVERFLYLVECLVVAST